MMEKLVDRTVCLKSARVRVFRRLNCNSSDEGFPTLEECFKCLQIPPTLRIYFLLMILLHDFDGCLMYLYACPLN